MKRLDILKAKQLSVLHLLDIIPSAIYHSDYRFGDHSCPGLGEQVPPEASQTYPCGQQFSWIFDVFLWIFPDQNIFYISYVFYTIPNTQSTFDLIRAADCVSTQRAASESTLIQLNIMRRKGADLTLLKYSSSWKYWFNQISPKYEYLQELTQIGQCLPKNICKVYLHSLDSRSESRRRSKEGRSRTSCCWDTTLK